MESITSRLLALKCAMDVTMWPPYREIHIPADEFDRLADNSPLEPFPTYARVFGLHVFRSEGEFWKVLSPTRSVAKP
jgi:hypothetical protein